MLQTSSGRSGISRSKIHKFILSGQSLLAEPFYWNPYLQLATCSLRGIVDHTCARKEEDHVDEHDDGERSGEENEQGTLLPEPTQLCVWYSNRFQRGNFYD